MAFKARVGEQAHARESDIHVLSQSFDPSRFRLAVLDMDGTLYSSTKVFDMYSKLVFSHLPFGARARAEADYERAKLGIGPCIGATYDVVNDLVLSLDARMNVVSAKRWDGTPVPEREKDVLYPGPIGHDTSRIFTIGDGWWIPVAVASHHAGCAADARLAARASCSTVDYPAAKGIINAHPDEYRIAANPEVARALAAFRAAGGKVVVASNSGATDMTRTLEQLGILHLCDEIVSGAGKPAKSEELFRRISEAYSLEEGEGVSIGDNVMNELLPAKDAGFQTIFIGSGEGQRLFGTDARCGTIESAMLLMDPGTRKGPFRRAESA